jgi:hypothetical protein
MGIEEELVGGSGEMGVVLRNLGMQHILTRAMNTQKPVSMTIRLVAQLVGFAPAGQKRCRRTFAVTNITDISGTVPAAWHPGHVYVYRLWLFTYIPKCKN